MRFQQKCYRKIEEFKQTKTVLFVSHDLSVVNKYCDRAIWINEGQLMDDNTPEVISRKYQAYMMGSALSKAADTITLDEITNAENLDQLKIFPLPEGLDILGDNKAQIIGVSLLDYQSKEPISILTPNQKVQLIVSVVANEYIEEPIIGFSIKDRLGNIIAQSNSYVLDHFLEPLHPGKEYVYGFVFTFPPLSRGDYTISPAIASGTLEDHVQHNWVHDALVVQMLDNVKYQLSGIMSLDDVSFYQFG
jgi:hypothetical protein